MKLKACLMLGVLLLCAAFTQTSRADEKRDAKIKAEMIENYLLWQEALKIADAERIISFEAPDFTWVMQDRRERRTKEEADERMRASMKSIREVHEARVEIKKLTIESNRVVVLIKQHSDVNAEGNAGNGSRLFRFSSTVEARDIWVEYDRVWMLKRREYLLAEMKVNFADDVS